MTRVELNRDDDLITVVNKVENINDTGVDLIIPEGSVLFESVLNLKLLKDSLETEGKVLHFTTNDARGNSLIDMLEDADASGYLPNEIEEFEDAQPSGRLDIRGFKKGVTSSVPSLPPIRFPHFNFKYLLFVVLFLGILGGGYVLASKSPKADIRIVVKSQPLTRSVSIKVIKGSSTNSDQKILRGNEVSTTVTDFLEIDTTGEKEVGEKAEGKIKIFNKTSSEIVLKKGAELAFKQDDEEDLFFYLSDGITIPPLSEEDPTNPASVLIPGEAEVGIIAANIGSRYNIDADETLEFEDFKKSELLGKTSGNITGGESSIQKIVAEEDLKKLEEDLYAKISENADSTLKKSLAEEYNFIDGSVSATVQTNEFDKNAGEEAEKVKLVQTVVLSGLSYPVEELNDLLNSLVVDFVPEGYEITDEDREINVEVLGNSDSSVLSSSEADLQVTVKTFVATSIDEDALKEKLAGQSVQNAEKVLGGINNVKTYELNIDSKIPLFRKVPKNLDHIQMEIVLK